MVSRKSKGYLSNDYNNDFDDYPYQMSINCKNLETIDNSTIMRSEILTGELSSSSKRGDRTYSEINVNGEKMSIRVFAKDSTILRAATNSIERWLVAIDKTINLYKEMKE